MLFLLGGMEDDAADRYVKLILTFAIFYARREILVRWKLPPPPTLCTLKHAIDAMLPLYKLTYKRKKCPRKFAKIWSAWIDAQGQVSQ